MLAALDISLPSIVTEHWGWWAFGSIVGVGLLVLGLRDLSRFSISRAWAISGVCFDESLRRRVLWITPLAMIGVLAIAQFSRPFDEQDAVRQTIKYCLFATGLVVVVTTLILACTNLPREIENRVIYTVVTKPTTRLELVLGKVLGFARVSAAILLIMGTFSLAYLQFKAWRLRGALDDRLAMPALPAAQRANVEYHQRHGLLFARSHQLPKLVQVVGKLEAAPTRDTAANGAAPAPTPSNRLYFFGESEQSVYIFFELLEGLIQPVEEGQTPTQTLTILTKAGFENVEFRSADEEDEAADASAEQTAPTTLPYIGPFVVPAEQRENRVTKRNLKTANLNLQINEAGEREALIPPSFINNGNPILVPDMSGTQLLRAALTPQATAALAGHRAIVVALSGIDGDIRFWTEPGNMRLLVSGGGRETELAPAPGGPYDSGPYLARLQGRFGTFGQQLRGGADPDSTPAAIFTFSGNGPVAVNDGKVTFEFVGGVERSGAEVREDADTATTLAAQVRNWASGELSAPVMVKVESGRPAYFEIPAEALGSSGNFDLVLRCRTNGHFPGLNSSSLALVTGREPFALNLAKSLLIFWLLSLLVTAAAVCTSTFLSWPIAFVLTMLFLLGHWGVEQLGDATQPGIGRLIVNDLGLKGHAPAEAVSQTIEALTRLLNIVGSVLPDISRYAALEHIERGISVPGAALGEAARITFGFGLPLLVLAYQFLKNKEVAP